MVFVENTKKNILLNYLNRLQILPVCNKHIIFKIQYSN